MVPLRLVPAFMRWSLQKAGEIPAVEDPPLPHPIGWSRGGGAARVRGGEGVGGGKQGGTGGQIEQSRIAYYIYTVTTCSVPVLISIATVLVSAVLRSRHEKVKKKKHAYFILTRTHSMHIFGEIPFIKPQKVKNANNFPSTEQAAKTQPKQDQSFSFIFHRF